MGLHGRIWTPPFCVRFFDLAWLQHLQSYIRPIMGPLNYIPDLDGNSLLRPHRPLVVKCHYPCTRLLNCGCVRFAITRNHTANQRNQLCLRYITLFTHNIRSKPSTGKADLPYPNFVWSYPQPLGTEPSIVLMRQQADGNSSGHKRSLWQVSPRYAVPYGVPSLPPLY